MEIRKMEKKIHFRIIGIWNLLNSEFANKRQFAAGNVARRERERRGEPRAVDLFGYNARYELASASLGGTDLYAYAYDAIGNRVSATETTNSWAYTANALNQYTLIVGNNDGTFIPEYDGDGNQTLVKTETGVWRVAYNGENRPVAWSNGTTAVEMAYDDTGRRRAKRVVSPGAEVLRTFLYDGYLLIAESAVSNGVPIAPVSHVWDPAEPVATRALCTLSGTNVLFHTHDLTKNVWELLSPGGSIMLPCDYLVTGKPSHPQCGGKSAAPCILYSSEYFDAEIIASCYPMRHYQFGCARWLSRDGISENGGLNLYVHVRNMHLNKYDFRGYDDCTPTGAEYIDEGPIDTPFVDPDPKIERFIEWSIDENTIPIFVPGGGLFVSLVRCKCVCKKKTTTVTYKSIAHFSQPVRCEFSDGKCPVSLTYNKPLGWRLIRDHADSLIEDEVKYTNPLPRPWGDSYDNGDCYHPCIGTCKE